MIRKIFPFLFALILITCQLVSTSHAAPFAYIANYFGNTVSVIDLSSKTVTADIVVDDCPLAVAINPTGTKVYVTNTIHNTVSVIDTATNSVTTITGFTGLNFGGIAISPDGKKGYVAGYESGKVFVIETATNTIANTIEGFTHPNGIIFSPDGSKAYVSNHTAQTISVIDVPTDTVNTDPIPVGNYPSGLVTNASGTRLYAVCGDVGDNIIVAVDTASNRTIPEESIPLGIGGFSNGIAINPAGTKLYATSQSNNELTVVNIASHSVEATVETGLSSQPLGVSVTPDGKQIVVVNGSSNSAAIIDSATLATTSVTGFNAPWSFGSFIASPPAVTDGLVSFWRGEGNAFDVVGGNNGTWSGTQVYAAGTSGQAFSFNGTDAYIDVADTPSLDFGTGDFTISFWMNLNALTQQTFVHKTVGDVNAGTNQTYFVEYDASNSLRFRTSDTNVNNTNDLLATVSLSTGTWYQVTAVRSGATNTLYLNGSPIGSQTSSGVPDTGTGGYFRIGQIAPNGVTGLSRYVNGKMDEIAIYNRALSSDEVSKLAGTYPDAFSFPAKTNVELNTLTESDAITISGISQSSPISITNGSYQINGGTWTSSQGTVPPGASVKVRLTASSNYNTTTTTTLTIGGVNGTFSVTTLAEYEKPKVTAFSLAAAESTFMSIGVSTFTATDNDKVSGYMITSSSTPPLATDAGWSATAPTSVILTNAGDNVFYAWAKDPSGNVSDPLTAPVYVSLMPVLRGTSNYYIHLQNACVDADSGETIKALAVTVPGDVIIYDKNLTIKGGYANGYGGQNGVTTIGTLTVGSGSLTVDRLAIR